MEKAGKNRLDYKRVNRGLVMQMVATARSTTRTDLVRSTGLSKMAISNIVNSMIEQNYLVESGLGHSEELGRKPVNLAVSDHAPKVVGLAIQRNRCDAVLCDLTLQPLNKCSLPFPKQMDRERLLALVFEALDAVMRDDAVAVGISSIGPICAQHGLILKPNYFYGIENVQIVDAVSSRYGLPTFFDHDNQSAVLAERLFGNARDHRDVLFVGIGQGVGCGILADDKLCCNSRGLPPELGHVSIDVNGKPCICGNRGCVEAYVRTPALIEELHQRTGSTYSLEAYGCMEGNEIVDSVFADAANRLATAIVSVVNLLNSELILLGNDAVFWPDCHIAAIEAQINQRRFVEWSKPIEVKRAHFRKDAALMGAACNALKSIFDGNLIFDDL